jgi:exopolysaccharide biosynthesis polyprenyl glycosylphosphotransferase
MRKITACLMHWSIVASADIVLANLGYLAAFAIRWGHLLEARENFNAYFHLIAVICAASFVVFHLSDLYGEWIRRGRVQLLYSTLISVAAISTITMALGFWSRQFAFPRSVIVMGALLQFALISGYRLLLRKLHSRWLGNRRTIVVGSSAEDAFAVAEKIFENCSRFYAIEACVGRFQADDYISQADGLETVVITSKARNRNALVRRCVSSGLEVLVVPNLQELALVGSVPMGMDDVLVFALGEHRPSPPQAVLKRAIDIAGSAALLVLTSPLLLALWIMIPLTSSGPAVIRQRRVGQDGVEFELLKLRTMIVDAEKHCGPVLATAGDARITKLGAFLRAARIDELPQLFNVLAGQMSLVGPRPERPFFVEQFLVDMPSYALRHLVKPGLTGLAQVMAKYSSTADRKLRFDLLYVYNYSLFMDLKILFQTIRVVLQREQAAGLDFGSKPANISMPQSCKDVGNVVPERHFQCVPNLAGLEENVSSGLD